MAFREAIRKLWPRAPQATINGIAEVANDVFRDTGLTTPLLQAHFLAQISHECGAGTIVRENMNYTAQRLMQIFGVGVHSAAITSGEAAALAHHPEQIAERVYGLGNPKKAKELGNTRPGDGWKFRGNGMLQLTGGGSHKHIGDITGFDLYDHPEMLEDPATSFRVAAVEFKALNCIPAAQADNVVLVTKRVNGGKNGLAERTVWLRKWKEALNGIEPEVQEPRGAPTKDADVVPAGLLSTRTGQIGTATGVVTAVSAGAQVVSAVNTTTTAVQTATDTISSVSGTVGAVKDAHDQIITVYQVAKPFLGLTPQIWGVLAIGFGVAALFGLAGILWYRHVKIRDQGE